jgi:hypothetical protein
MRRSEHRRVTAAERRNLNVKNEGQALQYWRQSLRSQRDKGEPIRHGDEMVACAGAKPDCASADLPLIGCETAFQCMLSPSFKLHRGIHSSIFNVPRWCFIFMSNVVSEVIPDSRTSSASGDDISKMMS